MTKKEKKMLKEVDFRQNSVARFRSEKHTGIAIPSASQNSEDILDAMREDGWDVVPVAKEAVDEFPLTWRGFVEIEHSILRISQNRRQAWFDSGLAARWDSERLLFFGKLFGASLEELEGFLSLDLVDVSCSPARLIGDGENFVLKIGRSSFLFLTRELLFDRFGKDADQFLAIAEALEAFSSKPAEVPHEEVSLIDLDAIGDEGEKSPWQYVDADNNPGIFLDRVGGCTVLAAPGEYWLRCEETGESVRIGNFHDFRMFCVGVDPFVWASYWGWLEQQALRVSGRSSEETYPEPCLIASGQFEACVTRLLS